MPTNYVWDSKLNKWSARKRTAKLGQLGRISIISPRAGELFYLRLLLCYRKCPKSFFDLRTVNGAVYETFKLAANATGLLDNDDYLRKALIEANNRIPQYRMRRLFAVMLYHCEPQDPKQLWEEFKHKMCLDFMNRSHVGPPTATMIEKSLALITHHYRHIGGDLNFFPLETLASDVIENYALSFMTILSNQRVDTESPTTIDDLNLEQKEVFDKFLELIDAENGGVIFLDAPGGTGKTFLLNFILGYVRRTRGEILATASSGIAATLLTQGKTVHSTFNVPLNIINKDNPSCALSRSSPKAIAIGISKAIIIDEAPMLHKKVYHAIDFSLKDVLDNDTLFGGKPILMSGDFRQILTIIIRGHRADTVNATIKRSYIWPSVEVMKLKTNMRVQRAVSDNEEQSYFARFLNDLGDGKLEYDNNNEILIPSAIGTDVLSESQLIAAVYSDDERLSDPDWISERTILCSTNRQVKALNDKMIARCSGSSTTYISIDTVSSGENEMTFPVEVLNSIEISGLPSHTLKLKIGTRLCLCARPKLP